MREPVILLVEIKIRNLEGYNNALTQDSILFRESRFTVPSVAVNRDFFSYKFLKLSNYVIKMD